MKNDAILKLVSRWKNCRIAESKTVNRLTLHEDHAYKGEEELHRVGYCQSHTD